MTGEAITFGSVGSQEFFDWLDRCDETPGIHMVVSRHDISDYMTSLLRLAQIILWDGTGGKGQTIQSVFWVKEPWDPEEFLLSYLAIRQAIPR